MPGLPKYYLVAAAALPEVFRKVAETLHILETGRASTVGEAVRMTGISRSAFYKYRDAIRPFFDSSAARLVTFHMVLIDSPGVLSRILAAFAGAGANILSINQSIPIGGVASVTISAETEGMTTGIDSLLSRLERTDGVTKIELIAG